MTAITTISTLILSPIKHNNNNNNNNSKHSTKNNLNYNYNYNYNYNNNFNKGGRFTCLFSSNNNKKQDQVKKALENALGGKKKEFEFWDKEIKKREEAGGGGIGGGGGGWFGWFRGSNGDHFWQEAQQASLAILCLVAVYLLLAKGDVMLAVIVNPLLFSLRGTRNAFTSTASWILQKVAPNAYSNYINAPGDDVYAPQSAKETVVRKWGSD